MNVPEGTDAAPTFQNFDALESTSETPAVLVLGGSTFMGRETVQALLALPARVCVVNRGRRYWGSTDPSDGRVARVLADRHNAAEFASRLDEATRRMGQQWALVADFSAYNGDDIRASLAGLKGRFQTYAYISSDSVYEVSSWAAAGWRARESCETSEQDSLRPSEASIRKRLKKADSYGDGKLEAEEALAAGLTDGDNNSSRSVSLRLPDVIGPFDDTLRLWAYWHWLRAGPECPPEVKCEQAAKRARRSPALGEISEEEPALAVVFSRDVARFVTSLLRVPPSPSMPRCDAVNLACREQLPMRELLRVLAEASGIPELVLKPVERPKSFLPSVDRPWRLCCKRMSDIYGFTPTPLEDVMKVCGAWFAEACVSFPREAVDAAKKLPPAARSAAMARAGLSPPTSDSSSEGKDSGSDSDA